MGKKKVVLFTNLIPHYRISFLNLLAEEFDLTVVHFGSKVDNDKINFTQKVVEKLEILSFTFIYSNINKFLKNSEVVILDFDFRVINHLIIALSLFRKYKLIIWTIGVSASYKKKFDSDLKTDWIRFLFFRKSDALVFYSEYPINKYINNGFFSGKLFVANNTVESIEKIIIPESKRYFLFVGTLYKEKGIIDLLDAYIAAKEINHDLKKLIIIGDGVEWDNILKIINANNLSNSVIMKGAIFDSLELLNHYKNAICTISPGQAGLSVLNSFSLGVPFVTTFDAITGGERLNIINGENGFLYTDVNQLADILLLLNENDNLVNILSKNAQNYYYSKRTLKGMVNGFAESINYVLKHDQS